MSDPLYCPIGLAVIAAVFVLAVLLVRSVPRVRMFDSPEHFLRVWRDTRNLVERLLVLRLLARHVSTGVTITLLVGILGLSGSLWSGLCGMSPESLAVVRGMLKDVLDFLARLLRPGSAGLSRTLSEAACRLA